MTKQTQAQPLGKPTYVGFEADGPFAGGEVTINPKTFKSGKIGWWGQARLQTSDGHVFMVQVQAVRIGS